MANRIADTMSLIAGRWRWRKARSLADLADLQADRLARRSFRLPIDEHDPQRVMYAALVALGRHGVVVLDWRLGTATRHEDTPMATRACVTGLADDATKDWLDNLLYDAGNVPGATRYELTHVFELYAQGCEEWDRSGGDDACRNRGVAWVERIGDTLTARIGGQMTPRQVHRAFPTRAEVETELQAAWQITICAPTWGDSSMFFDLVPLLWNTNRPGGSTAP